MPLLFIDFLFLKPIFVGSSGEMSHVISWASLDLGLSDSSELTSQAGTLFWSCTL